MLSDEYRPTDFADYVGQEAAVAGLQRVLARAKSKQAPLAVFIGGPSGTGKTTAAWIAARSIGCDDIGIEELDGDKCDAAAVDALGDSIAISPLSGEWKAVIVNECHAMTAKAVQKWLTLLERLPPRRLIVFTSTESTENIFGAFTGPFMRRCVKFELQAVAGQRALARLYRIADAEVIPLDGPAAERLLTACNGNFGEALSRLEAGNIPPADKAPPRKPVSADTAKLLAKMGIAA